MSRWAGIVALACLLAGTSTAIAQTSNDHPRTFGVPQALAQATTQTRTAVAIQFRFIPSPVCPSVHGSSSTVPITENTSAVRASNLPDTHGVKRRVRRRTDEGHSMSRTPSSTRRTGLFFTSTASKNQLSSVPMKLMQPFANIRARLERRRR